MRVAFAAFLLVAAINPAAADYDRLTATYRAIACQMDRQEPYRVCLGTEMVRDFTGDRSEPAKIRAQLASLKFRFNAARVDSAAGQFEALFKKYYARRYGSFLSLRAAAKSDQLCRTYDPGNRSHALRALDCKYPEPPLMDFEEVLKDLVPALDGGFLYKDVSKLFHAHRGPICRVNFWPWIRGLHWVTLLLPPTAPEADQRAMASVTSDLSRISARYPEYADEIRFLMNMLAHNCHKYWPEP
jgi:hypothetical protein